MGRLLEALRAANAPATNPAKPANLQSQLAEISKISEISSGCQLENDACPTAVVAVVLAEQTPPDTAAMRSRLLALAATEYIDVVPIHAMSEPDLADCVALNWDDRQCVTFLHWIADTAKRQAGCVPAGDTAAMLCQACGPVWIHPDIASVLPVVNGWPRALGCPWCLIRKASGVIPRPPVSCADSDNWMR